MGGRNQRNTQPALVVEEELRHDGGTLRIERSGQIAQIGVAGAFEQRLAPMAVEEGAQGRQEGGLAPAAVQQVDLLVVPARAELVLVGGAVYVGRGDVEAALAGVRHTPRFQAARKRTWRCSN